MAVRRAAESALVKVRVTAGARKERVRAGKDLRTLLVEVRAEPIRNEANARVLALVAKHLNVEPKRVQLIRGHHSSAKLLKVIMP